MSEDREEEKLTLSTEPIWDSTSTQSTQGPILWNLLRH